MITRPKDVKSAGVGETLFGRFDVLSVLGSGGFGRVLRCRDRDSGEEIALKELHRFGGDALLLFKKEFRALSDVQHPNLVRLGELLEGQGRWAFSLEYVPGTDVLSWVRTGENDPGFDEVRLRAALVQLVHGLMAIHGLGMLHRDVKPRNVRVTPEGRVVLLDFGLVMHLSQAHVSEGSSMGTVAYMAPEQAHDERLGPSADWYALGVVLYESLTGQMPFDGTAFNIMLSKQRAMPPRPSSLVHGVPPDLDALCMALLATHPLQRMDGEGVLRALSAREGASLSPPTFHTRSDEPFVGRVDELSVLRARFDAAMAQGMQIALLEGESGIGKSVLMEHFVTQLAAEDVNVLVLRGRCHAAEQLGYKAFDGAVDELSKYLKLLSHDACRALLPHDAHLLPVLFPVLARVAAVAREQMTAKVDRVERYPLFAAFTELLSRLGASRSVVLAVDDLQWADEASLVLLRTLLDSSRAPRLLVLGTVRPLEGLEDGVGEGLRALAHHERVSRHDVGLLAEHETRLLASRLVGDVGERRIAQLALESGGHPLFVTELARHTESFGPAVAAVIDLDAAILQRVSALPLAARLALELLCVASGPLPQAVLRSALGISADAIQPVVGVLRAQKLARTARRGEIVSYHDRMREAVLATIDEHTLAAHHRKLALGWEAQPSLEPARVAQHWLGCGQHERAVPWLEQAAHNAEQGGAFERAVEHYRRLLALEDVAFEAHKQHVLKLKLSEALAGAGRCAESALELLDALETTDGKEALDIAIRAAQRLLQAGRIDEGLGAAKRAFELIGMAWPETRARVVVRLLYNRASVALSRVDVKAVPTELVPEQQLFELDALKRLMLPMAWADFLRDAEIVTRHTRLALRVGERSHVAYAFSSEACLLAIQDAPSAEINALFARAEVWQRQVGSAELDAHAAYMRGTVATLGGDLVEAESQLESAHHIYRSKCPSAVWELTNVRGMLLNLSSQRGCFVQHSERAQAWIDEASARGDAFARATYVISGFGCNRHLLRDQPRAALAEIAEAMLPWRNESVGVQQFTEAFAVSWIFAYLGDDSGEQSFWSRTWPRMSKSFLFRTPYMREGMLSCRLLSSLARGCATQVDANFLSDTQALARRLHKPRSVAGRSFGALMRAQLAWLSGDRETAAQLAGRAQVEFERSGVWFARLASLLAARAEGSVHARDMEKEVLEWLVNQGWTNPQRAVFWVLPVARGWD